MGAPVLIGAGIGAATSLATGGNPLQGALLGGIGGGAFGGSAGLGSGFKQGGLFSLGSGLGSAGTVATSTPTLGGLALEGAKTGAVGGALAGGGSGTVGAGMNDYVGRFVPEHLTNGAGTPMDGAVSLLAEGGNPDNMPLLMTTEGAKGTPLTTTDKLLDAVTPSGGYSEGNFISDMVRKDPMGSAMLTNAAAQNLLSRPTSGIQTSGYIPVKKGSTDSSAGAPLNVLSPSDYGYNADMVTDDIPVTGSIYSMFPEREKGFGGRGMFYKG